MIQDNGGDVSVNYVTAKANIHEAGSWDEMMKFIIDSRPIVVYQFWIDTIDKIDTYKMLFSKVIPAPDNYISSEV
jgi:hypothetical protein